MKITSTFIITFIYCFIQLTFGQDSLKIEEVENTRLIKVLNNTELIAENRENYLSVRIYTIDNGSGSAGFPTCQVSHDLLIAVSEFGEVPDQKLFEIGPFYNPKFLEWKNIQEYLKTFEIEYGIDENRKIIKLQVDIDKLAIVTSG